MIAATRTPTVRPVTVAPLTFARVARLVFRGAVLGVALSVAVYVVALASVSPAAALALGGAVAVAVVPFAIAYKARS